MKKKSLYDIAMKQKEKNTNNKNIDKKKKGFLFIQIINKVIKLIIYVAVGILLTIGATVLINSSLREQLINIIRSNI